MLVHGSRQVLDSAPQPDRFHLPRYSILPPAGLALFSIRPEHFELAITAVYDQTKTLPAPDWGDLSDNRHARESRLFRIDRISLLDQLRVSLTNPQRAIQQRDNAKKKVAEAARITTAPCFPFYPFQLNSLSSDRIPNAVTQATSFFRQKHPIFLNPL
ncbi:uncharacterized protein CLUP02_08608 [Colletotrichum lupini]|uniref:Uncharacterized protein n=1 Tax=Colletotrichum lupini TaxID=145971 RepID=A0A9Q8STF3_9PEZI|nr:uncharacterized protein CLUP02_08608 [Colletotrichum lupini]UQC83115.1 hypothetical protein CLUP02_08608 [Colletotrichum lupini]